MKWTKFKIEKPKTWPKTCRFVDIITEDDQRLTDIPYIEHIGFYWVQDGEEIKDVKYWMYSPTRPE